MHELVLVMVLLVCNTEACDATHNELLVAGRGIVEFDSHNACVEQGEQLVTEFVPVRGYVCKVKPQRPGLRSLGL